MPDSVLNAVTSAFAALQARPLPGGLYLVATPIGHLGDVTLRALAVLAGADRICCEDTRHTRRLLDRYGISATLSPYHEHNAEAERPRLLAALAQGRSVALVSDAGTPLVSDPGYKLVRGAIDLDLPVTAVPGPSASLAALSLAGLPTDAFLFGGFLPHKAGARRARIAELAGLPMTLILFEAPGRVAASLADLAAGLGPERPAALARELTKLHETVLRGTLGDLAATCAETPPRGECVLVVGGAPAAVAPIDDGAIDAALVAALDGASLRDAVQAVSNQTGAPRQRVYARALTLRAARKPG